MSTASEIANRRTFAIISHPDAGKTTMTESLLLNGGAIQMAGTVKAKKSGRHAVSDWMEMEKQRGISVTSSVMQFTHNEKIVNLLDTPGHADFSEDTYRTLTAVDSALMVIDSAKGVEERTIKLMEVCRLRTTPIMTFINKLDREGRDAFELMDEIETVLNIQCAPLTWPIGMGKTLKGIYRIYDDSIHLFEREGDGEIIANASERSDLESLLGLELAQQFADEIELLEGASDPFDIERYLRGEQSPVFFGSALAQFGVTEFLDQFVTYAPSPLPREAEQRIVEANETKFTGFVFKIQANMDPNHHDRIAFLRITSGHFTKGLRVFQVRTEKVSPIHNAITFQAARREHAEDAYAGDIIGLHNHGSIRIGDTFTEGEELRFVGIPSFAPELFRRVILADPLRAKALNKGLDQLSEEGATQVFRPLINNDIILGAVGILQFDVVAHRLKSEYSVDCRFENIQVATARWLKFPDEKTREDFKRKNEVNLALDGAGDLTYIAPNRVNLNLTMERWPNVEFFATKEI